MPDVNKNKNERKHVKRYAFFIFWILGAGILIAARTSQTFAENIFARRIYKIWSFPISWVTDKIPFSLAEILIYACIITVFSALISTFIGIARKKKRSVMLIGKRLMKGIYLLGVIFFLFAIGCGGNYYRTSYAEFSGLTIEASSVQELSDLYLSLTQRANRLRTLLTEYEDTNGVFSLPYSVRTLGGNAVSAMETLGMEENILSGYYPRPKPVLWSRGMSRFGITGVFCPYTMEANVNVDTADYSIGAAMCHELSHVAGFMREDEANFIAYRACKYSGDTILEYSGTVLALIYTGNELFRVSPEQYQQIRRLYCDGLCRDISSDVSYWDQFEDSFTDHVGEKVNDIYLKANNQETGVQSYGEMVDLLLAEYRREHS